MYKKFRSGKTRAIYTPVLFVEELMLFVRKIDDMEDPKKTLSALNNLLDELNFRDKRF